jgi:hypothetical protein
LLFIEGSKDRAARSDPAAEWKENRLQPEEFSRVSAERGVNFPKNS